MICCDVGSWCNITITDSTFNMEPGQLAIDLKNGANSYITIVDCIFSNFTDDNLKEKAFRYNSRLYCICSIFISIMGFFY